MKRFILKVGTVLATAGFLAGATYAYFSSAKVTLTNITLATGTPEIQVSLGNGYSNTLSASAWSESNLYPGKESAMRTFYLRNVNPSLPISIVPTTTIDPATDSGMGDNLEMQFSTNGIAWNDANYHNLTWWLTNATALGATLSDDADHQYWVKFRLSTSTPSTLTGKTATFTIGFEGHTP